MRTALATRAIAAPPSVLRAAWTAARRGSIDGCSASRTVEAGFACDGNPSVGVSLGPWWCRKSGSVVPSRRRPGGCAFEVDRRNC